jgi:hypothetical protein
VSDTSWIKPGAPVAYYVAGRREGDLTVTTVRTVAKLSFTVDGCKERFRLRDLETKRIGGTWGYKYRALHPESEEAARITEAARLARLRSAAFQYLHHDRDSVPHIDKAIATLTAWRAELTKGVAE